MAAADDDDDDNVEAADCMAAEDISEAKGDGPRFKKHVHRCLPSSLRSSWSVPQRLQVFSPAPVWLRICALRAGNCR